MSRVPPARAVADFDSASAFVRSVSSALRGQDFAHLGQHPALAMAVRLTTPLPRRARQVAYSLSGALEARPARQFGAVDMGEVAGWLAGHYPERRYPAVFMGSSNGALTHLYAATGSPWLPQTLLLPVRRRDNHPHVFRPALDFGREIAGPFLDRNPDVRLHQMHDGNEDELMLHGMAYFRPKWLRLPAAYRDFLARSLEPGAPVVVVHDALSWPTTRVSDRHLFQAGAPGGLGSEDYRARFDIPEPDGESPEAEWGFAPELLDDVHRWAADRGHPVHEIRYRGPQAPAAAVASMYRDWLTERGEPRSRLLVESFVVHDPWQVLRTGTVPFWTYFPVREAADALARYLDDAEPYDEIDVVLFNHGADSAGLVDARSWHRLALRARERGRLLAVRPQRFPVDLAAFARYGPALRRLPAASTPWSTLPVSRVLDALAADPAVEVRVGTPAG